MRSLTTKLVAGLVASMAGVLLWLGAANLRVLRENLETTAFLAAQRMADVIFRSTHDGMLRNDRTEQLNIIRSIGVQEGVRKVRVISKTGAIQVSNLESEVGTMVDIRGDACIACHASSEPLEKPATKDTFRFYRIGNERVIGLIRPIENEPACSNAACHAHPPSQRILGVLDIVFSLDSVDQTLAAHERRMSAQVIFSAVLMILIGGLIVWVFFSRPLRRLIAGVQHLGSGDLAYRFRLKRHDEIGALADAFDQMAEQVETANRTLETRIQQKTKELEAAQDKLIHSEKLASLGQLSAAVAHEINNPLAGIFTYARLLEKKLHPGKPALDWIQTIQRESRRCGDIVSNLLIFARKQHTEMAPADVQLILDRTVTAIEHRFQAEAIQLVWDIPALPKIVCDASQIQQVLTVIMVNAVDAMSTNGNGRVLKIAAALTAGSKVDIALTNNGPPIPKEVLPHIFEPFFSTKQAASGVGLGLAVAYGIVKRHGGEIQVDTGAETTFHVLLPVGDFTVEQEKSDGRGEILHTNC